MESSNPLVPIDDTAAGLPGNVSSVLLTECAKGPDDDLGNFLVPFPYQRLCQSYLTHAVIRKPPMRATLSSERNVT